jgi:prepilin-type N-terminal cleavage/methylation domain-containing protein
MNIKIFIKNLRRQSGLTLLEVLIGVAISGLLGTGIVTALIQLENVNSIDSARMTSVKQVENAMHYLDRDVQMAQKVEANGQDYWLKLSWTIWDTNQNIQVKYIYNTNLKTLSRAYSTDGGAATVSIVGNYITAAQATAPNGGATPPEKAWTFQLTSAAVSKLKQATETRQIKIVPRPGS